MLNLKNYIKDPKDIFLVLSALAKTTYIQYNYYNRHFSLACISRSTKQNFLKLEAAGLNPLYIALYRSAVKPKTISFRSRFSSYCGNKEDQKKRNPLFSTNKLRRHSAKLQKIKRRGGVVQHLTQVCSRWRSRSFTHRTAGPKIARHSGFLMLSTHCESGPNMNLSLSFVFAYFSWHTFH